MNNDSSHLALELVRHRILGKCYSKWRAIIAELGESDTNFLRALREVHGIYIDKQADPMLYVAQDTQQMRLLAEDGVPSPTLLQILLTSKAMALTEEECEEKWQRAMKGYEPA